MPTAASAQLLLTQDEALRLAFPEPATVERKTAFLRPEEVAEARRLAGDAVVLDQALVTYYEGRRGGHALGTAYFDAHRVRTLQEVVMIVVTPEGRVARIEVLKFMEPPDYRAPEGWLDQFEGRELDEELSVRRGIVNMTGATLTSGAITRAVRRVLALHRVIGERAR